jgi:hypothetical protein
VPDERRSLEVSKVKRSSDEDSENPRAGIAENG